MFAKRYECINLQISVEHLSISCVLFKAVPSGFLDTCIPLLRWKEREKDRLQSPLPSSCRRYGAGYMKITDRIMSVSPVAKLQANTSCMYMQAQHQLAACGSASVSCRSCAACVQMPTSCTSCMSHMTPRRYATQNPPPSPSPGGFPPFPSRMCWVKGNGYGLSDIADMHNTFQLHASIQLAPVRCATAATRCFTWTWLTDLICCLLHTELRG